MLIIDRVSHVYDQQCVLDKISFNCAPGSITCLIGPSGCGKTTLLRLTAGLLTLQSGSIQLDGKTMANDEGSWPPERRPVGLVFQEGALFPHMTVADNVGFGLPKDGRTARVRDLLEQVELLPLADRYPDSLSGGQRQRVALARALAPRPRALLFDEPYANLDMQLRKMLRDDARRMIRETGTIGLFVTHDPEEVLALGDHAVVLDRGGIVQQGSPQTLYDAPTSMFVAQLFGDAQVLDGILDAQSLTTPFGIWDRNCLIDTSLASGRVKVAIHPHQLRLESAENGVRIDEIRPAGARQFWLLVTPETPDPLVVEQTPFDDSALQVGSTVRVAPLPGSVFATSQDAVANENDSH